MVKRAQDWKSKALENLSYKIVAFFVTLILWITILGRRDIVLTKEVDLEFLLPPAMSLIENNIDRKIEVKVSGPRIALKKFAQNPGTITVDLSRSQAGLNRALITPRNVEVPFGVKVLSVYPEVVNVTLVRAHSSGHPPAD